MGTRDYEGRPESGIERVRGPESIPERIERRPGVFAEAAMAERSIWEMLDDLALTAERLHLYEQLFGNFPRPPKGVSLHGLYQEPADDSPSPLEAMTGQDLVCAQLAACLPDFAKDEQKLLQALCAEIVDPVRLDAESSPPVEADVSPGDKGAHPLRSRVLNDLAPLYGFFALSPDEFATRQGVSRRIVERLRLEIGSRFFPMGMGWRTRGEYWLFLIHALDAMESGRRTEHPGASMACRLIAYLRRQWGAVRTSICVASALRYLENGYRRMKHAPRSATRIAAMASCPKEVAHDILELFRYLPESPFDDITGIGRFESQETRDRIKGEPELVIHIENGRPRAEWGEKRKALLESLLSDEARNWVKKVDQFDLLDDARAIASQAGAGLADQADLWLLEADTRAGSKMIMETARIEAESSGVDGKRRGRSGLARYLNRLVPQQRLRVVYEQFENACKWKVRLTQAIVEIQSAYLSSGDRRDLKPLTKADIVRRMGALSSGNWQKGGAPDRNGRAALGRRLERYMKFTRIQLPDGQVCRLDSLLTGSGGVLDKAEFKASAERVKARLKDLLDRENPAKPLSDRALAEALAQPWESQGIQHPGFRISRRTVAKYRDALGVPSSQVRRNPRTH